MKLDFFGLIIYFFPQTPILISIKHINMGFNIQPNFNIFKDGNLYFQNNSNFDEFLFHPFFEDIQELGIEKKDSKFFNQIENYMKIKKQLGVATSHILSPTEMPVSDWKSVVMKADNPYLIFIVIQLVFFLSKKRAKSNIKFDIGCDDIYKNTISILNGEIRAISSTIEDHPTYEEYVATEKLSISLDEIILIFKKMQEKTT